MLGRNSRSAADGADCQRQLTKPQTRLAHVVRPSEPLQTRRGGPVGGTAGVPGVRADGASGSSGSGPGLSSGILGFGYVRGYDSGFGPLQGSP